MAWLRPRYALLIAPVCAFFAVVPAIAQEQSLSIPSPILTIDQDRLFAETVQGTRLSAELEDRANKLAEENEEIERQLVARELELTEQRSSMPTEEFKALADAFDRDVQRIRAEQDEKAREISRSRDEARQTFINEVGGIVSDIVRERRALIVLDRRDVFLSADRIDITDDAIARINNTPINIQSE